MKTNVRNDLSNVVKKGTSLACSWSQVGRMSEGAPDEHPMSIRSASDGERWKPAGEKGSTRVWKHVAMIFAVLVLSIANVGMAWGAYDVPANGTVTLSQKVNNSGRFNVEASGVYHFRSSNYSWDSGIKTQSNNSGVIFYLDASTEIEVGIKHTESKNAHNVTVHVYSIPESEYKQFDDNKAGAEESNRTFSTGPSTSSDDSFTISVAAETKTFKGTKTLAAGYYAVVPVGEKGKTFFTSIKFTSGGVTKPTFSPATGSSLVKSAGTVTLTSAGNTVYYKWSQTDNQYASGAGATLAGAADGSGSSPVNATAPSTTGTWYLYAVAKNGGDYSNVVKATYTITNPTYTLTWNLDGGTATGGTAAGAVAEGATLTVPTVTKVGYDFAGWSPSVPATMPSSDATYTATWTKVYASGTYNFYNNATLGTSPNQKTITTSYADYNAFRIDNIFFSNINMAYEGGSTATGSDYKGWKIKKNNATIKFFVENDSEVTISIGRDNTLNVSYTNTAGASQTPTITSGNSSTYSVKGGTMVTLTMSTSSTITIKQIAIAAIAGCTAPNHVDISGNYHFFPGETLALTATAYSTAGTSNPIAAGDITGYRWQKYIGSDWEDIVGETSATYTKANATTSDVGQYRCIVSTGATCSTTSGTFNAKCLQLYVYWDNKSDKCNLPFTKVDGTHATVNVSLENGSYTYYYKVTDGCGNWWGNTGTMTSGNCSGWNLNVNSHCGLTTTKAAAYTFNLTYNAGVDAFSMSVVYPSSVQVGGYNLYFANDERNWSNIHYRIGRSNWNSKAAMTLVPGTANLYQTTTIHYESDGGFEAWHIANNGGWSDGNSIYKTKTGDGNAITNATSFEGAPVPSTGLTVIPGSDHSTGGDAQNNNCEFYSYTTVPGMKRDRVTITAPTNGTITVNYTSEEDVASSFSATTVDMYQDLAHTVIITPTATPAEGYTLSGLTVNGAAHTSGNTYTVTANTTIAATFSPASYTVTLNTNGGTINAGNVTSYTYGTGATLPTNVTKDGFTFGGWYDNSGLTGDAVTTISSSATGNKEFWAKWTCVTPTFGTNLSTSTVNYNVGDAASALTVAATAGGGTVTYQWYSNDENNTTTPTTLTGQTSASYTPSTAAAGTTYYYCVATNSTAGCSTTATSNITPVTVAAAAVLTALESGTLYKANGIWSGDIPSSDTYKEGLSDNNKFFFEGSAGSSSTMMAWNTYSETSLNSETFTSILYFKGAASVSSNVPSTRAMKFILPSAGSLTIYYRDNNNGAGKVKLNVSESEPCWSSSEKGDHYATKTGLSAGTYYLYATAGSTGIFGVQFDAAVPCTSVPTVTAGSNSAVTSTTATVSCASGISSLGTGGCTITSYGFVLGTSANPTLSNTVYEVGTSYASTGTSFSKDLTGLTASTTYYVRPYATNGYGTAYGTQTSFTTAAAEPEALVHWTMKINNSAWGTTATATTDGTNITSINTSRSGTATGTATSATVKVTMASAEVSDNSAPDNSANFTFTVNSAKKVVPEKVTCQVFNVSSGNRTYKAQISDNNGHVYNSTNTLAVSTEATLTDATFNFASGGVLVGDVTLKIYAWKTSGSPTEFRMGQHVKFYGEVQSAADYTVTHTMSNVTKSAGATSVKEGNNYTATYAGAGGYTLPSTITVTIGGSPATAGTDYTWTQGTGVVTIPGNKVTGNIVITVTGVAPAPTYSVTHSLTNVTATSGATGAGAATEGVAYEAVFAANSGYVLPSTITVTIGGSPATVGTGYTWNASTGAFQVPAAQVTGAIVITIAGETAPTTKDIYYGHVKITDGALVREIPSGATQFFTNIGGTVANNTEISLSSTPSTTGMYYNSNNLTDAELSKSSNWSTSSGSNRYIRGLKFANGTTYTLALGTKVASAITFYGWCGSASKTMTVGGEEYVSSSTKNTFAKHVFTKSGDFTGNVTITQDGDFYGILVITIQTAAPCTTPVISSLSNQALCEGNNATAWNATVTNAAAISAAGETVSYQWQLKNGSNWDNISGATSASYDVSDAVTEAMAGTYRVVVTVSKAGYSSSSATSEVTLSVTEATEVTGITADKATVYPGNSVTLTATANTTVTWQWYTCTNAEGDGEVIISGAESASYTIASAGVAGTYYYKAVATGDCGTAEAVYTLTVTAASECEKYFWFVYAADATSNGVINNRDNFFGSSPKTGSSNSSTYKFTLDGTEYTATRNTGDNTFSISFTVPEGSTATLALNCKGSSSKPIYLIPTSGDPVLITDNSSNAAHVVENIAAGTYKVGAKTDASASWTLAGMAVQVCTASTCTDATPTITAANTTVCVGSELSISSTGYETGATFQWQKLNSSTSTWDNISGATSATYTVATAAAEHAGSYRLVATKGCARTSNTVTISVPSVPNFGSTVPASVSVMQTIALSINTVEATDAVKYRWYKSADGTWDAGDVEIGTDKTLIKAYDGETAGSTYYIFCRAQNACGITTSSAIAVNVTAYVEEDCATRGNEGEAHFGFENTSCSQGTYSETAVWTTNSRSKYLTYTAPEGKYFKTAKVTVAVTSGSKCGYAYSTDGGTTWTYAELTSLSSTLTEKTINLSALGGGVIDAFRISRNLQDGGGTDHGVTSGNFHLSKACFEYTNACTATTVTVSPTSKSYTIGGAWTPPTITLGPAAVSSETLTYSSSDEDIATVDDDGTVNFQGIAGTVTITASYAGGEVNSTQYCASEGSYTITVSCSDGAPKIFAASSVNLSGCNTSVTLEAKQSSGTAFSDGTYQWYLDGEPISGATLASYTAVQAGVYTVERTGAGGCTNLSSNSATVTSETTEPEVERLVPFQYYHVDKTYSDQMKMRHLFAVKNSGKLDGKSFKMYVSRSGGAATDVTSSNALVVVPNGDGHVDTVMVDLNKLIGKYSENDELVFTCKAIDCSGNVSEVYKETITMNVIGATPTMALILNGKGSVVGGDFLEDYEPKNLQEQTGSKTWGGEWPMYTDLKTEFSVTPVNGYAPFNKLNYEPFDIIFLTDFPKASKSDAAATILDDMYELVDFRPMFSFKTHMVHKSPSKWALKGFTTSPTENKGDGRTYLNIVCYAHPMFEDIKTGDEVYTDASDGSELVYKMLSGTGYEKSKGMQGFEIDAAENFVTIGLTHYNASVATAAGVATWTPGDGDRMLVSSAERQANPEARMILLSLNAGAHSKLTAKGRAVVMKSLEYLIQTSGGLIEPADCSYTFDNAAGDHNWSTAGNWGPRHNAVPGPFTSTRIAAAAVVDIAHAHAMEVRIVEGGSIEIPAGKGLEVKSTVRHMDGAEISPTEVAELSIGSASSGNGTLIFNNKTGDTKAGVAMYSKGFIDYTDPSKPKGIKNYQYIGVPCVNINAAYNYYGSWIYSWSDKGGSYGWQKVVNGGIVTTWTGYCITQESAGTYYAISGTLAATGTVDIDVPAGENMVVGNSWTAPISIQDMTTDDFENLTANIYFFNTGVDKSGGGTETENATGDARWAPGTYVSIPIASAPYTGSDDHIPSLQGFFVKNTSESAGVLHLDYDRHVRGTTRANILSGEMHAPRRAQATDTDEPVVLKIKVSGENYDDKLLLLAREDFSMGFDNGWDGDKWDGNESALYIYTKDEAGTENSVSAIPEMEGTVIGFRAGEDDAYTLHFEYLNSAEELYLFDTETNAYTKIMTGATYRFFTDDKEKHERFIITRKSPQIATDVDDVDSGKRREVRKLLIEDKMYILVNGMLYDATGKVVK